MPGEPSIPSIPSPRTPRPSGPCVLLKHGEVFLKGRNRHLFTERLHDNLRRALRGVGGSTWIKPGQNVTVLGGEVAHGGSCGARPPGDRVQLGGARPARPEHRYGHHRGSRGRGRRARAERPGISFAVRAKRRDKGFEMTSSQFERFLGARVREALEAAAGEPLQPGCTESRSRSTARRAMSPGPVTRGRAGCPSVPADAPWCCSPAATTRRWRPTGRCVADCTATSSTSPALRTRTPLPCTRRTPSPVNSTATSPAGGCTSSRSATRRSSWPSRGPAGCRSSRSDG